MQEYSRPLGDVIKRARGKLGLTQNEVADAADIDVRTVLNIENYKGNPKMEVLYPLVRVLKIDAREIFNPEIRRESPALRQLRLLSMPKGKYIFGTVKVGERGQIVIPKEARELFDINPGDTLLVMGDKEQGIAIAKADVMKDVAIKILKGLGGFKPNDD